ncbi:MAG TPA: PDR/VanB family oxidoreductase [Amnibacterium sp.]|uniref:PDR/VanB family oxidoreductase n=1 Tax=Amnibacterium sp. TaxID=1872496 RepID=UPI002F92F269
MTGELRLTVRGVTEAAADVVLIDLARPDGGALPRWAPGAHLDVVLPGGLGERQYSLCGDPAETDMWRIGVLREEAGRGGSVWLHERAPGDTVTVRGPANHFTFEPFPGREYVFVAGGIGITPIAAMVRAAEAAGVTWRLLYAGRSRGTMAFLEELVGRHRDRVQVFAGDEGVRADIPALLAESPDAVVYACGPARLLAAVEEACAGRPSGHLHLERFEAKVLGAPVFDEPFEVELLLSGITVTVPPERSILEVVEEAGVLALSSCRVGTCGTCETPIIDGEVDHRDSVLSPEEQDDNFAMMICVSRAACPRITIEL